MRSFVLLFTILACFLALAWSAVVEQPDQENQAENLLDVDAGVEQSSSEGVRQARQFFGGGYYGRPYYGGYGGYGGYGRPYYGGYGGYGRPYYGGYGGFGRPYYGGYGGFYG
ncbi:protein suex-1 [Calliphora vicina]|uniref:protein suex-1 n=1 Tax=Calliphora vicina TaxID=7373 RepID=UPI00325BF72C